MPKKTTPKAAAPKAGGGKPAPCEQATSPKSNKSYIVGATFGQKEITYAQIEGRGMVEGDIDIGSLAELESVRKSVEAGNAGEEGVAVVGFRWPDGILIYNIDPALPNQARVTDAIAHIAAQCNLNFRLRTTEANFITYRPSTVCSSQVGMRGGQQFINLAPGCGTGSTIHETLHAAGLWHEQSREDRNNFVTINFPNITPANAHNFDQHITDGDDIGFYDYDSIMHYPRNAFAINTAIDTITPKPNPSRAIGQRAAMSHGDILAINTLYPRKTTLGETSSNGPALTNRNGQLLLAWTGVGNLKLNFLQSNNGLVWGNKVTLNEISPAALAVAVHAGKFYVAWIGVGNNQLNIMQSSNGLNWSNKVTLADTSQSAPALASFNGKLYLAWRGVGNNQLNVMSSANGVAWGGKVTLAETTPSGPALTALGGSLLLGWRGVGNNFLNVIRSGNGTAFSGKVTLGETTLSQPALATQGNRAILSWRGVGNQFLNALRSLDGIAWGNKLTSKETCADGPAVSNVGTRLLWGWTGTDPSHRLNTMLFNVGP